MSSVPDPDFASVGPNLPESRESVVTGSTQPSNDNQNEENTFAEVAVRRIESVIDSFRTGKANKAEALGKSSQPSHQDLKAKRSKPMTDISPLSMESRPSLLNRLEMDRKSAIPYSESERRDLIREVEDMQSLTGILLPMNERMTSTSSLTTFQGKANTKTMTNMTQEGSLMKRTGTDLNTRLTKEAA